MRDFTLKAFEQLLVALQKNDYKFFTFEEYLKLAPKGKVIILRHDVDLMAINSLRTAIIENQLGIKGTYYFRIVKQSNKPRIIKQIVALGHEMGYHYEDLALARGNVNKAIHLFEENLKYFRQFYPITTVCMHGSPISKWDNRKMWEKADYKKYGLIGEPYFDMDFNKFAYLTDTGRKWNADKMNMRDQVRSAYQLDFKNTSDIIKAVKTLPQNIMITTHPQRWNNNMFTWGRELIMQNSKNIVKTIIKSSRK